MAARPKLTVVGAGNVGASVAQYAVERELGDVVLVDVVEGIPQGKALDLAQAGPVHGYDSTIVGSNGYDETAGSDIVVITAGLARKPGMTRDDLLVKNAEIVGSEVEQVVARSPESILIRVSSPREAGVRQKGGGCDETCTREDRGPRATPHGARHVSCRHRDSPWLDANHEAFMPNDWPPGGHAFAAPFVGVANVTNPAG